MKIAFYISSLETSGGAERALIGLANWLSKNHKIIIVVERGKRENTAYYIENSVEYVCIDEISVKLPIRQIALLLSIRKIFSDIKPDIIVSFLALANIRLLASGVSKKFPVVVCERNDPISDPDDKSKRKQRDKLYRNADRIIVQTDDVKEYFENLGYKKVDVIHNFVNTIPYKKVEKEKVFVSIGRLSKQKNQKWLIDGFVKSGLIAKGYKLVIYGNGELKRELLDFIKLEHAEDNVTIHDAISNILEEISKAYAFVLTSLFEGMPNALMEAMSMGLPCISTNCPCGGPRSLIDNGKNGILVELDDLSGLINAMNLVADDDLYAKELGKNAFCIRQTHGIETISNIWMESFQKTLQERAEYK